MTENRFAFVALTSGADGKLDPNQSAFMHH